MSAPEHIAEDIAVNCAPSSLAVITQQVYADTMRDVFEASDHAEQLMHESMTRPAFPPLKGDTP